MWHNRTSYGQPISRSKLFKSLLLFSKVTFACIIIKGLLKVMFISTWFHLGFNKILVREWIFPSCFFKRKFNCVWLTFLYYEIWACLIYSLTQKLFLTFLYFQFVKIFHVIYLFWRILNFLYKFFCKPCQWNVWYIFYIFVISLSKIF